MARGPKISGGIKKDESPIQKAIWMACVAATVGALLSQAISIYMPNWREAGPVSKFGWIAAYNYIHKASKRQHMVEETKYGLHSVVYDNYFAKQTWADRLRNVKTKGFMAIQNSSMNHRGGYKNFFVNECPSACRDAISARIRVYENLLGYNNLVGAAHAQLLTALVVSGVVALLGVFWYLCASKNVLIVGVGRGHAQGCWILGGGAGFVCTLLWNRFTHKTWLVAIRSQMVGCGHAQIPFPYVSTCYRVTLIANAVMVGSALVLFFSDVIGGWFRRRKSSLNDYLQSTDNQGFGAGFPGMAAATAPGPGMPPMGPQPPTFKSAPAPGTPFNPGAYFSGMGVNKNNMNLGNPGASASPNAWTAHFKP